MAQREGLALKTFMKKRLPVSEERQQDVTDDAARMRTWLEDAGGAISLGGVRLKSVKVSKNGKKLTLVIKKKGKKSRNEGSSPV